jgi:hypothetical protein
MKVDRAQVSKMSGPELIEALKGLTGETVKRFASRAEGIKRVLAALDKQPPAKPAKKSAADPLPVPLPTTPAEFNGAVLALLGEPAKAPPKAQEPAAPVPAPAAAPAPADAAPAVQEPAAAPAKARSPKALTIVARAGDVKPPRPESKRGQLLVALQTAEGISVDEMMARFVWKAADCGDALRLLAKQNGVSVARGEDGRWRVVQGG